MLKNFYCLFILASFSVFSQQRPNLQPITITGTVIDADTNQPLEYATIVLQSVRFPDRVTGGITDANGKFSVETVAGNYNIRVEFISYKNYELKEQALRSNKDLGTIKLAVDVAQLEAVEVVGERTTVELRLDKKVYNVGQDLTVRGGSVTDVLDNVPSVAVDVEGNISLRGNENVRILINGKPSALSGISPETLRQLPADAIEKVEVITNPSARYDAEGSAGILNIVLKQNKITGFNGTLNVYTGYPDNHGAAASLNLRTEKLNIFTNTTYRYEDSPGNALNDQENFDANGNTTGFQKEIRDRSRQQSGFTTNLGFEFLIDSTSSITNSFVYRKSSGENPTDTDFFNFDAAGNPTIQRNRFTLEDEANEDAQYSLNYIKRFNNNGHELTVDYQYSSGKDFEDSVIEEFILNDNSQLPTEETINDEKQKNQLVQFDYVRPFGKDNKGQFELGYRGTFNVFDNNFTFGIQDENGQIIPDPDFTNNLVYKEYVNAAYTQLGNKFGKFNLLGGIRMEASRIGINLLTTRDFNLKKYTDWFPSVFIGYEFSEKEQLTLSYSRRLNRPRNRLINPFPSRESNTNLFQGNPDLDPAYTNAFDFGYLNRWEKFTFNTSAYYNRTTGSFQVVTLESGDFVDIDNPDIPGETISVPIQIRTFINLATENRYGMEFTTVYTPKRNWRLTWNLNLFQQQVRGDFTYVNFQGEEITQNFDADNFTWFTRFSAKLPLPWKIDFQTNTFYSGPQKNAQSTTKGILSTNLAFSKDILKDKGTLSFNVSDLFNSRIRRSDIVTRAAQTYSEFQWRERQFTLSFLYRFNKQKNEREQQRPERNGGDDFEFEG